MKSSSWFSPLLTVGALAHRIWNLPSVAEAPLGGTPSKVTEIAGPILGYIWDNCSWAYIGLAGAACLLNRCRKENSGVTINNHIELIVKVDGMSVTTTKEGNRITVTFTPPKVKFRAIVHKVIEQLRKEKAQATIG